MKEFDNIGVWNRGMHRAPHKPLLLLILLGRQLRGDPPALPFSEAEPILRKLLIEFGPTRKSCHPEYPFWHLKNDGLWSIDSQEPINLRPGSSNPSKSELLEKGAVGSFTPSILAIFKKNPELVLQQTKSLLDAHFPASLHSDIASSVGIDLENSASSRKARNPKFRGDVLVAYEYKCAVCNLDMRIGSVTVGIEAAHIKWHQAGGPDTISNGLALCSLHHKLLDLGAFTILEDLRLVVSEHVHGGEGFESALLFYHGKKIRSPQNPETAPAINHLAWHRREVFKEKGRFIA